METKLRQELRAATATRASAARAAHDAASQAAVQHAQRAQQLRAARADVARLSGALKEAREALAAQRVEPPGAPPAADEALQSRLHAAQRALKAKACTIDELRTALQAVRVEKTEVDCRLGALEGQLTRSRAAARGKEAKIAALQTQLNEMQRCALWTATMVYKQQNLSGEWSRDWERQPGYERRWGWPGNVRLEQGNWTKHKRRRWYVAHFGMHLRL